MADRQTDEQAREMNFLSIQMARMHRHTRRHRSNWLGSAQLDSGFKTDIQQVKEIKKSYISQRF